LRCRGCNEKREASTGGKPAAPQQSAFEAIHYLICLLGNARSTDMLMVVDGPAAHAPPAGIAVNRLAVSATTHCLTGCAIGEVIGMAIATAFGWGNLASIATAVVLAYFFGFGLTAMPLIRAGLAAGVIVSTALAADTVSITIMEAIDNLTVILIPDALDAGLSDALFYASIAAGFAIAYPFAFLANRYLIARGRGHAVVHEYHDH
jgi:Domain of unknown function (DUF4396)